MKKLSIEASTRGCQYARPPDSLTGYTPIFTTVVVTSITIRDLQLLMDDILKLTLLHDRMGLYCVLA